LILKLTIFIIFFILNASQDVGQDNADYDFPGIWLGLKFWHPVLEKPDHLPILMNVRDSLKTELLNGPFNDYLSRDIIYISQYLDDHYFVLNTKWSQF